jgi:MHS family shikimate/dehydroshikimate transporter-like MFS transporter
VKSASAMQTDDNAASMRTVAAASAVGTTIEWYDFLIYGTAASIVLNKLFFPTANPLAGTLLSIGTIGVGFFARPIGAIILSHFGDRLGRKSMLILTLVSMGVATTVVGLLRPIRVSASRRRSCWSCAGWCRALPSAASGAARC